MGVKYKYHVRILSHDYELKHSIEQYVYKCFIVHVVARKKILFQLKVDYKQLSLNQDVRNPLSVYIFLKSNLICIMLERKTC